MRVLACTVPETQARLRRVLAQDELEFAFTTAQALEALARRRFDLVLIGMLFDESRGLELLRRLTSDGSLSLPPFVGMRGAKNPVAISPQVFDLPMWTMGAADVIDFGAIPDDERGNRSVHERLLRCAAPPG